MVAVMGNNAGRMPSTVDSHVSLFDRFASAASRFASRATFFAACVLIVALWAPTILIVGSIDTWQLIINTLTTIITFLLVALLQNAQERADQAVQQKLNALSAAMACLMEAMGADVDRNDIEELRAAVGLEDREDS